MNIGRHLTTVTAALTILWAHSSHGPVEAQPPVLTASDEKRAVADDARQNTAGAAADNDRVMAFAREHHAELAELLVQLKKARSPEFQRAIRELSSQVERIERIRERTPARFEAELAAWKTDSQIRLLVARWAMSRDPVLEQRIRELLEGRRKQRIEQLQQEHERLKLRIDQINTHLAVLNSADGDYVNDEFVRLTRRITAAKASRASGQGNAAKESSRSSPSGGTRPSAKKPETDN